MQIADNNARIIELLGGVFVKRLLGMLGCVLLSAVAVAQTPSDLLKAPDIAAIQSRGILRVAMTHDDQPPFYSVNSSGELVGLDVYLADKLAAALNVKPVFIRDFPNFNDVVTGVEKGEADVAISKLSRTLKRAQAVRYSQPYITFHQALLLNRLQIAKITTESGIKSFIRNFRGKIGVIADSSYVSYAHANFPHAEVVPFDTWNQVVDAVLSGKVLAAYRDELECRVVMEKYPQASLNLKLVVFKDQTDPIAIATNWRNQQLASFVDILLNTLNLRLDVSKILHQDYLKP